MTSVKIPIKETNFLKKVIVDTFNLQYGKKVKLEETTIAFIVKRVYTNFGFEVSTVIDNCHLKLRLYGHEFTITPGINPFRLEEIQNLPNGDEIQVYVSISDLPIGELEALSRTENPAIDDGFEFFAIQMEDESYILNEEGSPLLLEEYTNNQDTSSGSGNNGGGSGGNNPPSALQVTNERTLDRAVEIDTTANDTFYSFTHEFNILNGDPPFYIHSVVRENGTVISSQTAEVPPQSAPYKAYIDSFKSADKYTSARFITETMAYFTDSNNLRSQDFNWTEDIVFTRKPFGVVLNSNAFESGSYDTVAGPVTATQSREFQINGGKSPFIFYISKSLNGQTLPDESQVINPTSYPNLFNYEVTASANQNEVKTDETISTIYIEDSLGNRSSTFTIRDVFDFIDSSQE